MYTYLLLKVFQMNVTPFRSLIHQKNENSGPTRSFLRMTMQTPCFLLVSKYISDIKVLRHLRSLASKLQLMYSVKIHSARAAFRPTTVCTFDTTLTIIGVDEPPT